MTSRDIRDAGDAPGPPPPLPPGTETPQADTVQKRVGWAEVFFDLVFVLAVTQVTTLLRTEHSWAGAGRALVVFIPIYWAWVGTAVHANTHDVNNLHGRLAIFSVALCGMFMALAVPGAYTGRGVLFAAAYLALRIILAVLVRRGRAMVLRPFLVAVLLTGPLLLAGGFLPAPARTGVWALAAGIDLATPALARRALARVAFDSAHLPERFALFLIIALGESIVAIGGPAATTPHLETAVLVAVGVAFALIGAMWWLYFAQFGHTAEAIPTAMASARAQTDVVRQVLTYAHLALIGAIIAIASGITAVIIHPSQRLDPTRAGLLFGGCAVYLTALNYTHRRIQRRWSLAHLLAAAVTLALLPATGDLPALAVLTSLGTTLIALTIITQRTPRPR